MVSANRDHIWNGNPLGQGPIALVALVEGADVTGTTEPVFAAATSADEHIELVQEQIAPRRVRHCWAKKRPFNR